MLNLADLICTSRAAACSKNTFGNNYIIPLNINAIVINGARIKHPRPLYATHLLKYIIPTGEAAAQVCSPEDLL